MLKVLTNIQPTSQLNSILLRDRLLRQTAFFTDILEGLVAGADTYTDTYDVTDRDEIRVQVSNLGNAVITPQISMGNDTTGPWTALAPLATGINTLDGSYRLLRFNFPTADTSGGTPLASPAAPTLTANLTGGSLADASYQYRVSALDQSGNTLAGPEAAAAAVIAGGGGQGSVTVTWAAVSGAASYNVYGRTAAAELLMANIIDPTDGAQGDVQFIDNGSITPSGALPLTDTAATPNPIVSFGAVRGS